MLPKAFNVLKFIWFSYLFYFFPLKIFVVLHYQCCLLIWFNFPNLIVAYMLNIYLFCCNILMLLFWLLFSVLFSFSICLLFSHFSYKFSLLLLVLVCFPSIVDIICRESNWNSNQKFGLAINLHNYANDDKESNKNNRKSRKTINLKAKSKQYK